MRKSQACLILVATSAVFALGGCREHESCESARAVRVLVEGRPYALPVTLRPSFDGVEAGARLPSYADRAADGRWAYCQGASAPAASVHTFAVGGLELRAQWLSSRDLRGVTHVVVGSRAGTLPEPGAAWPRQEVAGYRIIRTQGPTYVYRSDGAKNVFAMCMRSTPNGLASSCRIDFSAASGTPITFDLGYEEKLTDWDAKIAAVEAWVRSFEMPPRAP